MHIAVCDDEKNVRCRIRKLIADRGGTHSIAEYRSGEELLAAVEKADGPQIDLLFLDISMEGGADGMEVAKRLRETQADQGLAAWGSLPLIIFVSGYAEYMPEAFGVQAFQFLVKPIDEAHFAEVLRQAEREYRCLSGRKCRAEKTITVGGSAGARTIAAGDILYVESVGHHNVICSQHDRIEYYGRISDLEQALAPDFFRIHRGYLINLSRVDHYDRSDVYMEGGDRLSLSRYKYQEFVKTYLRYLSEEKE